MYVDGPDGPPTMWWWRAALGHSGATQTGVRGRAGRAASHVVVAYRVWPQRMDQSEPLGHEEAGLRRRGMVRQLECQTPDPCPHITSAGEQVPDDGREVKGHPDCPVISQSGIPPAGGGVLVCARSWVGRIPRPLDGPCWGSPVPYQRSRVAARASTARRASGYPGPR